MKEIRYFYAPDVVDGVCELPAEEAAHCVRVLRLQQGDEICLMDGKGSFYRAELTYVTNKRCMFDVIAEEKQPKEWRGHLHLAMAPTKNNDRTEWFTEKATEIGFDELSFINCKFSERKVVKNERFEKIIVSAMKQSHKAYKPLLNEMIDFKKFVTSDFEGQKFIAHCYDQSDIVGDDNKFDSEKSMNSGKQFLFDLLDTEKDALVMIGPEGDFSVEEVRLAVDNGFIPISLGKSRLRTETAALVAVHLMNIKHSAGL